MMGDFDTRRNGVLIAFEEGSHLLCPQERRDAVSSSSPQAPRSTRGDHHGNRPRDLEIGIYKTKQLTNRAPLVREELARFRLLCR